MEFSSPLGDVVTVMQQRLEPLSPGDSLQPFLATYLRTTTAVENAIQDGTFEDPDWVVRWDIAFAHLYLRPFDAWCSGRTADVPRPWRLAFAAPASLPPLRRVLLGINAHINYDLPQALLAVIPDADFADEALMERRRRDHERIDAVLSSRVADEDAALPSSSKTLADRLLTPLNRQSSKRFLREARIKVWTNTQELQRSRVAGDDAYRRRLGELEVLSAARIADLLAPGQVLLRLAVAGFGVVLPPE